MSNIEKSEKKRYTTYLPNELLEEVRKLSDETRVPQTALMEEAVRDLLTKYYGKMK